MARALDTSGDAAIVLFLCFAGMMAVAVLFAGASARAAQPEPNPEPEPYGGSGGFGGGFGGFGSIAGSSDWAPFDLKAPVTIAAPELSAGLERSASDLEGVRLGYFYGASFNDAFDDPLAAGRP